MLTIDTLAQEIRRVDGNHSLGAGALAEALMPFISAALSIEQTEPVAWIVREITPSNGRGPNTIITGSVVPRGYEAITPLYAHPPTTRIADSAEAGGSATLSTGGDHG